MKKDVIIQFAEQDLNTIKGVGSGFKPEAAEEDDRKKGGAAPQPTFG